MTTRIETFIDRLQSTNSFDGLQGLIENLRDIYQVDHVVYHSIGAAGEQYAALTYESEWVDHYIDEQYQRVDPVVIGAMKRFHPIDWKQLDWSTPSRRNFLGEAADTGVGNQGYSVPIRGPHGQFDLFSINNKSSDEEWTKFTNNNVRDMLLISHYVHLCAEEILGTLKEEDTVELSPRERDVLTLLGLGMSRGQAAEKLHISEHTFRVYVDTARHKLGALNTTQAVAIAMSRGLILL